MLMKVRVVPLADLRGATESACAACQVRPRALFSVLPGTQLQAAAAATVPLRFDAGEALYRQGDAGNSVFTLRTGIVRFERIASDGQRRIVRLAGVGALIGQESLLRLPYAEEVVACTPVQACGIPAGTVDEACAHQPQLRRELMRRWQSALDAAGEWTSELTFGPARRRMLKMLGLLRQMSADGDRIWLPSRMDMSGMLGLAPETASRLVSQFRREGILQEVTVGEARLEPGRLAAALARADH